MSELVLTGELDFFEDLSSCLLPNEITFFGDAKTLTMQYVILFVCEDWGILSPCSEKLRRRIKPPPHSEQSLKAKLKLLEISADYILKNKILWWRYYKIFWLTYPWSAVKGAIKLWKFWCVFAKTNICEQTFRCMQAQRLKIERL